MKKYLFILMLALGGCAGKAPESNQVYLLLETQQPQIASQSAPLLVVEVELAPYLDVNGIVYRTSDTSIVEAKQNQWAMSLADMVEDSTIDTLRANQTKYWPVNLEPSLNLADSPRLLIKLDKFNGSFQGNAEISGEWLLIDKHGDIAEGAPFSYKAVLTEEGYPSLVEALSLALEQSVATISRAL